MSRLRSGAKSKERHPAPPNSLFYQLSVFYSLLSALYSFLFDLMREYNKIIQFPQIYADKNV
jgi:hypothetical protein